jgi:hypothetical protein
MLENYPVSLISSSARDVDVNFTFLAATQQAERPPKNSEVCRAVLLPVVVDY